jgi:hypothetical protein
LFVLYLYYSSFPFLVSIPAYKDPG